MRQKMPSEPAPAHRKCCGKCAFRKGSAERWDGYGWANMASAWKDGETFFCHEGVPGHQQEDRSSGERWRACAGWAAHRRTGFRHVMRLASCTPEADCAPAGPRREGKVLYIKLLNEGKRRARKTHRCFDCGRAITRGTLHDFSTLKYDVVYTLRQHLDCKAASEHYRVVAGLREWDFDDGIPPLADMLSDGGEWQADLDWLRGRFPHVVCRLELTEQLAEIRLEARSQH